MVCGGARVRAVRRLLAPIAVALCVALPQSAQAVLVSEGSDVGDFPTAQAGDFLYSPSHVRIQVTASPNAAIQVTVDLQCERGRSNRRVQPKFSYGSGPVTIRPKLPLGKPDACYVGVTAEYADVEQAGEIRASIYGHGKLNQY